MSCCHGIQCTEEECLYSPSHWSISSKPPDLVIETFITSMQSCYRDNLQAISSLQIIPYGDGKQIIDIWGNEFESATAIALFHGGYWQDGDRKLFTSPVKALVDENVVVACVGYDFATTICLNDVIEQATKALHHYFFVQFLAKRWPQKRLLVGGHSAGAHLAISALKRSNYAHRYEKVILFSGIYDLHPLLGTYIGRAINLSLAEAETLSIVSLDEITAELLVIVGAMESPKFKEQSHHIVKNYVRKHDTMNISDCYKIIPDEDHFTLITSLADKNSITTRELLNFILQKQLPRITTSDSSQSIQSS
ncbi:ammd protein [Loa loa]|uniref:Ammd protein n=1 Tax=Loa loa TaxID=7209 RepID=A0A1S0TWD0_LOALO|nr:ammd protein [Loa loa]EFO21265.1 ammd protein [Loa loa]